MKACGSLGSAEAAPGHAAAKRTIVRTVRRSSAFTGRPLSQANRRILVAGARTGIPRPRDNAAMPSPSDDVRAFLAERRYATLATLDPDGVIHLTPVWFLFDGERFLFASFSSSR